VSDGFYSNVTSVLIYITRSNKYAPVFDPTDNVVSNIVEEDQSAVGRLITTVSHCELLVMLAYFICISRLFFTMSSWRLF